MGVNFPQAKYSGSRKDDDPHVPTSGPPQPVLDTSKRYANPDIQWGGHAQDSYLPDCGTHPTGSTDVEDPDARAGDATPKDILKGGTGNG